MKTVFLSIIGFCLNNNTGTDVMHKLIGFKWVDFVFSSLTFLLLLIPIASHSKTTRYKPLKYSVNESTRLKLTGFRGHLRFMADANTPGKFEINIVKKTPDGYIAAPGLSETFSVHKSNEGSGEFVHLNFKYGDRSVSQTPLLKAASTVWQDPQVEYDVLVRGQSVPLEVFWHEGVIEIRGWQKDFKVHSLNSSLSISETNGVAMVSQRRGAVDVVRHKGGLSGEFFSVKAVLSEGEGPIQINNYSGETHISSWASAVNVQSFNGKVSSSSHNEEFQVQLHRGALNLKQFSGQLKGTTLESNTQLQLNSGANVSLKSTSGNISIKSPARASINVGTTEGDLWVPRELKISRYPNLKVARGQISRGASAKNGRIYVRSQSGTVSLK